MTVAKVDLASMLSDARARVDAETPVEDRGLAKFARLARKDARIRPDQDAALTALAKALMRRRPAKTERITENTLIRVAIDLLLAHADTLHGSTEDQLRNSVTSALPNPGRSAPSDSHRPELRDSESPAPEDSATSALRHSDTSVLRDSRRSVPRNPRTTAASQPAPTTAREPRTATSPISPPPTATSRGEPDAEACADASPRTAAADWPHRRITDQSRSHVPIQRGMR